KQVSRFLRKHGLKNTISVPVRKSGLTGSGKANQCHSNVYKLVKVYGGKQLLGFGTNIARSVYLDGTDKLPTHLGFQGTPDTLKLYWHSVWITPEGKAVDVTSDDSRAISYTEDAITFIPCHVLTGDTDAVAKAGIVVPFKFKRKGIWLENELVKESRIRYLWHKDPITKNDRICYMANGGFHNPSKVTGKYHDEILKTA
ncbi:MAG: hypothetical protein QGG39_11590, partial [Candidatus Poribacteria bacterium]|nr:hypothetical protein [Candidatus Poribacteria bacterium]